MLNSYYLLCFCVITSNQTSSNSASLRSVGFLYFWGVVFLVTTTLVMIMKSEKTRTRINGSAADKEEIEHGIINTYLLLWKVIKLPAVVSLIGILLTVKVCR